MPKLAELDQEILDTYNSLSDDELLQLTDDEFKEFEDLTMKSEYKGEYEPKVAIEEPAQGLPMIEEATNDTVLVDPYAPKEGLTASEQMVKTTQDADLAEGKRTRDLIMSQVSKIDKLSHGKQKMIGFRDLLNQVKGSDELEAVVRKSFSKFYPGHDIESIQEDGTTQQKGFGQQMLESAVTTQAVDDFKSGNVISGLASGAAGLLETPARAIGSAMGKGRVSDEDTIALRESLEGNREWYQELLSDLENSEDEGGILNSIKTYATKAGLVGSEIGNRMLSDPLTFANVIKGDDIVKGLSNISPQHVDDLSRTTTALGGAKKSAKDIVEKNVRYTKGDNIADLATGEGTLVDFTGDVLTKAKGKSKLGNKSFEMEFPEKTEYMNIAKKIDDEMTSVPLPSEEILDGAMTPARKDLLEQTKGYKRIEAKRNNLKLDQEEINNWLEEYEVFLKDASTTQDELIWFEELKDTFKDASTMTVTESLDYLTDLNRLMREKKFFDKKSQPKYLRAVKDYADKLKKTTLDIMDNVATDADVKPSVLFKRNADKLKKRNEASDFFGISYKDSPTDITKKIKSKLLPAIKEGRGKGGVTSEGDLEKIFDAMSEFAPDEIKKTLSDLWVQNAYKNIGSDGATGGKVSIKGFSDDAFEIPKSIPDTVWKLLRAMGRLGVEAPLKAAGATAGALTNAVKKDLIDLNRFTIKWMGPRSTMALKKNPVSHAMKMVKDGKNKLTKGSKAKDALMSTTAYATAMSPYIRESLSDNDLRVLLAQLREGDEDDQSIAAGIESGVTGAVDAVTDTYDETMQTIDNVSEGFDKLKKGASLATDVIDEVTESEFDRQLKMTEKGVKKFKEGYKEMSPKLKSKMNASMKEKWELISDPETFQTKDAKDQVAKILGNMKSKGIEISDDFTAVGSNPATYLAASLVNDVIKEAGGKTTLTSMFREGSNTEHGKGNALDVRGISGGGDKIIPELEVEKVKPKRGGRPRYKITRGARKIRKLEKDLNKIPGIEAHFETEMPKSGDPNSWMPHFHIEVDDVDLFDNNTTATVGVDLFGIKDLVEVKVDSDIFEGDNDQRDVGVKSIKLNY